MSISEEEAYNNIKKSVEAINTRPYATKAEYEKVECIKVLLTAYEKEKEKNKKLEKELENQQKGMKNWEEIYDEDQNYIGELNDKIFDLKFEVKNLQKEIEELNKSDASKEQSSMNYYNLYKELEDKITARIEELEDMYNELPKNPKEHLHSKTEYLIVIGELQSLLKKE